MASLFRVRTQLAGGSGAAQLSTHYFNDNGTLTAQHAADAVHTLWVDLRNWISTQYTMTIEPEVAMVDTATGKVTNLIGTTTTNVVGNSSSAPCPWATQGLIRWQTGVFISGRQVKGHTFVPGPCVNDMSNGAPTSAYVAGLTTAGSNLISTINAEFMIYSRKHTQGVGAVTGSGWTKFAVLTSRRD